MKPIISFLFILCILRVNSQQNDCYSGIEEESTKKFNVDYCSPKKFTNHSCCFVKFRTELNDTNLTMCAPFHYKDIDEGLFEATIQRIEYSRYINYKPSDYVVTNWTQLAPSLNDFFDLHYSRVYEFDCKGSYLTTFIALFLFLLF